MNFLGPIISEALRLSATNIHLEENYSVYVRDSEGLHSIDFICTTQVIADIKIVCHIQDNDWWSIDTPLLIVSVELGLIYIALINVFVELYD